MSDSLQPHISLDKTRTSAKYALLPGDPKRLDNVIPFLENVEELAFNREFRSLRGWYKDIEILVVSTGIGGPSTAIVLHELNNIGVKNAIRIGSCGALQTDFDLGDLILASGAVRDEGTSSMYIKESYPAIADLDLLYHVKQNCIKHNFNYRIGIVRSHDSFYTDQEQKICQYWSSQGVLGADMETSALFVIGRLLGMQTASILNVVVKHEESVEQGISDYLQQEECCLQGEKNEIELALDSIFSHFSSR